MYYLKHHDTYETMSLSKQLQETSTKTNLCKRQCNKISIQLSLIISFQLSLLQTKRYKTNCTHFKAFV